MCFLQKNAVYFTEIYDEATSSGRQYQDLSVYDGKLYLLGVNVEKEKTTVFIEVYKEGMELEKTLDCGAVDHVLAVSDSKIFQVTGEYVYIENFDDASVITRIEDDRLTVVRENFKLDIAKAPCHDEKDYLLFVKRDTNDFVYLDLKTHQLYDGSHVVIPGWRVSSIKIGKDGFLLDCIKEVLDQDGAHFFYVDEGYFLDQLGVKG